MGSSVQATLLVIRKKGSSGARYERAVPWFPNLQLFLALARHYTKVDGLA